MERPIRPVLVRVAIERQRCLPALGGWAHELRMARAPVLLEQSHAGAEHHQRSALEARAQRAHPSEREQDSELGCVRSLRHESYTTTLRAAREPSRLMHFLSEETHDPGRTEHPP